MRALAYDTVVIPIPVLGDFLQGLRVDGFGDDFITTGFVVNFSPPANSSIDLVSLHLGIIRKPDAPNLNPGVHEAASLGELDVEFQFEVLVAFLCREKGVVRDLLLH